MTKLPFPIVGKKVCIRLPVAEDLEFMYHIEKEGELHNPPGSNIMSESKPAWLHNLNNDREETIAKTFESNCLHSIQPLIVTLKNTEISIGRATLQKYPNNEWGMSVLIVEAYRKQHVAREVFWLLARMVFDLYAATAVVIEFYPEHHASLRLAEFFYHNEVGSLTNNESTGNQLVYKITQEEYRGIINNVEERLGFFS